MVSGTFPRGQFSPVNSHLGQGLGLGLGVCEFDREEFTGGGIDQGGNFPSTEKNPVLRKSKQIETLIKTNIWKVEIFRGYAGY